jgi:hypothetical protein
VAGMPLTKLLVAYCPLRDISALADLPLIELSLDGTPVSDLRPLAKLKDLSRLSLLGCTKLARDSLPPLWGLPLVMVNLKGTPLSKPDVAAELRKRIPNVTVLIDEKTP